MILSWDKPNRAMSVEAWKNITADSAPPGVYTPNMSEDDKLKWKAKGFAGSDLRVEIRKSFNFSNFDWATAKDRSKYVGYSSQVLIVVRLDNENQPNIVMSTNGKVAMTFQEMSDLQTAIEEAKQYLTNKTK